MAVVFFLLTLLLAFVSWVGSIYGQEGWQSMLSKEGIRWELQHVVSNYVQAPSLGVMLLLLMGIGIGVRAGLYQTMLRFFTRKKLLSGKERRALILSLSVGAGYLLIFLLSVSSLRSVTGQWLHSPLQAGGVYILSVGLGLSGIAYGYASHSFRRVEDIVSSMSGLIPVFADCFVSLFFVVQFFSVWRYTGCDVWLGVDASVTDVLYHLCCYLPFLGKMWGMVGAFMKK